MSVHFTLRLDVSMERVISCITKVFFYLKIKSTNIRPVELSTESSQAHNLRKKKKFCANTRVVVDISRRRTGLTHP